MVESVALPVGRLSIGVTGHRATHRGFVRNEPAISVVLSRILDTAQTVAASLEGEAASPRLYSLLAFGADALAVEQARERRWEVVAPIPFGRELNLAINAHPETVEDALALLEGRMPADGETAARAARIRGMSGFVRLFELADEDDLVAERFLATLREPTDAHARAAYSVLASERSAIAGRVMIEQSDLLIAVWDGLSPGSIGGTRHTMVAALDEGVPVLWIDVRDPARVVILRDHAALDHPQQPATSDDVEALVRQVLDPPDAQQADRAIRFHTEQWHPRSRRRFHVYRRIEAWFGGGSRFGSLVQRYERPAEIGSGSGADLLARAAALPGGDKAFAAALETQILARFAWADGLSTYLSDAYRGGMVWNFLLSAFAIVVGVAYLPFASVDWKWPFAAAELLLLLLIVAITTVGRRRRWHGRWFETRRVAEYLRHAPSLLLLGVSRTRSRWPRGTDAVWPERYAREALREPGLPAARVTKPYLRAVLEDLLLSYVRGQRDYHRAKASRLARVHHNLDRISEWLFLLAILCVAAYLLLTLAGAIGIASEQRVHDLAKPFTFLGVFMPAIGGAFAGIRYFGDFERFSAISEVTAEKLDGLDAKVGRMLAGSEGGLCYARAASLVHAMDDIVVAEIESWQSVFAGKNIAVPV